MPDAGHVLLASSQSEVTKPSHCRLCGGKEFYFYCKGVDRFHFLEGEFDLFQCESCKLITIFPIISPNLLKKYYPDNYYSYSNSENAPMPLEGSGKISYYLTHPIRAINCILYSKILRHNDQPRAEARQRVLDVGCGDGRYLLERRKEGAVCFGVDISADSLKRLRQKAPDVQTHCGDLWDAAWQEGSFDLVNLWNVLEHVNEFEQLLESIRRLLKKGGRLAVQVPNGAGWTAKIFGKYWLALDVPRHVNIFSTANLKTMFDRCGYRIVSWRTPENTYNVLGSSLYVFNALFGKKYEMGKTAWFWDSEWLKLLLFPYVFLVNLFKVGDVVDFILEKEEGSDARK